MKQHGFFLGCLAASLVLWVAAVKLPPLLDPEPPSRVPDRLYNARIYFPGTPGEAPLAPPVASQR
jgi:hypothetical protein